MGDWAFEHSGLNRDRHLHVELTAAYKLWTSRLVRSNQLRTKSGPPGLQSTSSSQTSLQPVGRGPRLARTRTAIQRVLCTRFPATNTMTFVGPLRCCEYAASCAYTYTQRVRMYIRSRRRNQDDPAPVRQTNLCSMDDTKPGGLWWRERDCADSSHGMCEWHV